MINSVRKNQREMLAIRKSNWGEKNAFDGLINRLKRVKKGEWVNMKVVQ